MSYRRVIHRFWTGPGDIPKQYEEFGKKWEDLNPGWVVMDHGEEVIQLWDHLIGVFNFLYGRALFPGGEIYQEQISDIIKYALIEEFGGFYVDIDMEPVIYDIEHALPDMAWASYRSETELGLTAMGAPSPGNEFWHGLVAGIPQRVRQKLPVGVEYLTEYAEEHDESIYLFPTWTFHETGKDFPAGARSLAVRAE